MKETIVPIENFSGYYISDLGNVYSDKTGKLVKLHPYIDTKGNYLMIRLIRNDKKRVGLLLHRIVALHFIPNPLNLPEVNHKDKDKRNPKASNLEWCTRKENLEDSYTTLSPSRNCNKCTMYKNGVKIGKFESILAACRFAKKEFDASYTMLEKHLHYREITIIPVKLTRKNKAS